MAAALLPIIAPRVGLSYYFCPNGVENRGYSALLGAIEGS